MVWRWLLVLAVAGGFLAPTTVVRQRHVLCHSSEEEASGEVSLEALKRELDAVREAYKKHLMRSHDDKLEMMREHAYKTSALEASNAGLKADLDSTREAFGEYMKSAHDAHLDLVQKSEAQLNEVEQELEDVRQNYADFMVAAHDKLLNTTVPLQAELDAKNLIIDKLQADFDELQLAFNQHVEESDILIERTSDDLRAAKKALSAVTDAIKISDFSSSA